mmetsp:Transcript_90008/g.141031  ORF Transcript_90008/g.141031 Transcript_90008/m.141031 type:complete len:261 (+) Transcript_90008:39-821(+)
MEEEAALVLGLQQCKQDISAKMPRVVRYKLIEANAVPPAAPSKMVHFIRHGEGYHNVAQTEWRKQGKSAEPYDLEHDPDFKYLDPDLTEKGVEQAKSLQQRTAEVKPELLVVSPMRRAIRTGLLAFESQVSGGSLKVLAQELLHETAGGHTCDKRLPRTDLASEFQQVDFSLIGEEDPLWSEVRETLPDLATRAARFIEWVMARPEQHVAVATHSGFLRSLLVAVLDPEEDPLDPHFATGEMRSFVLTVAQVAGKRKKPD